jgi:hypothetical protein
MSMLPRLNSSLLVRTDFTSEDAWQEVSDEARRENEDGFRAYLEAVSDPAFEGFGWEAVRAAVPANGHGARVLFIADSTALTLPDHPVLVVDLLDDTGGPPFRCILPELWGVENNLNIANMTGRTSVVRSARAAFSAASPPSGSRFHRRTPPDQ